MLNRSVFCYNKILHLLLITVFFVAETGIYFRKIIMSINKSFETLIVKKLILFKNKTIFKILADKYLKKEKRSNI